MGRGAGQSAGQPHRSRVGERRRARARARQLDQYPHPPLPRTSGGERMTLGYNQPLYIMPFDHRGSFQTGMFGWKGALSPEQTAQIAAAKQVIYDGLKEAVAAGVPKEKAGI